MGKVISFTGHRPQKLYGYDISSSAYDSLRNRLSAILKKKIEEDFDTFVSGAALGFDTIAFEEVHKLKEQYPHIRNFLAIPFQYQYIKWNANDQKKHQEMKHLADAFVYVDTIRDYKMSQNVGYYSAIKMTLRNQYMVDHSNLVIACYDGTGGGTGNCIQYAKQKKKEIIVINPKG